MSLNCAICDHPISLNKKYQWRKTENSFLIGSKPFVGTTVLNQNSEYACHKCYQANSKTRVCN